MLILVEFNDYAWRLAKAPRFADISIGNIVSIEYKEGEREGIVTAILDTYYSDEKELEEFIVKMLNGEMPLPRVLRVARWRELAYPTEESEDK